jgi:hypothetical protein
MADSPGSDLVEHRFFVGLPIALSVHLYSRSNHVPV